MKDTTQSLTLETLYAKAEALHQAGELTQAFECYQLLLSERSDDDEILNRLAFLYYQSGLLKEAQSTLEKAIHLNPTSCAYRNHLSVILLHSNQCEKALHHIHEGLKLNPDSADLYNTQGNYWIKKGNPSSAHHSFLKALEINPQHEEALYNLARLFIEEEQFMAGIELYQKLLVQSPHAIRAHHNLAFAYFYTGDLIAALKHFLKTLSLNSDFIPGHIGAATVYGELQNWEQTIFHYQKALELNPHQSDVQTNLSVALLKAKGNEKSWGLLEELAAQHERPAEIYAQIGHLYFQQGNWSQAEGYFIESAKSDPENFSVWYNLGSVSQKQKKIETAITYYQKALLHHPGHEDTLFLLAALTGQNPEKAPSPFIVNLFDHYAPDFEKDMRSLNYQTPHNLMDLFKKAGLPLPANASILDLGCGTGLMGEHWGLSFPNSILTGVDLSPNMLEQARQKTTSGRVVYSDLEAVDMLKYLDQHPGHWDGILCADVLVYLGDLNAIFQAVRQSLKPSGFFLASAETSDSSPWRLTQQSRYQHTPDYLAQLAEQHGFKIHQLQPSVLRHNEEKPVPGVLFLLTLPGHSVEDLKHV